jgi:hypothetical protein
VWLRSSPIQGWIKAFGEIEGMIGLTLLQNPGGEKSSSGFFYFQHGKVDFLIESEQGRNFVFLVAVPILGHAPLALLRLN